MSTTTSLPLILIVAVISLILGYLLRQLIALQRKSSIEVRLKKLALDAQTRAQEVLLDAQKKAEKIVEEAKQEKRRGETELKQLEEKISQKGDDLEKALIRAQTESSQFARKLEKIQEMRQQLEHVEKAKKKELERIAQLTPEQAKQEIFSRIEKEHKADVLTLMRKLETFGKEELERKARDILATAIQRYAASTASDVSTTAVSLPSEDLKGKIIGKEGRNIRAFERAAGVEVIVDDTPESIIVSSFDPVRREIARLALENLIADGRIQPARIEEFVEKAKVEVERIIKEAGEQAAYETGVFDLDPRLITLLGRLKFRTSYGQNVLQHSVEMAHIASIIAEEIGADVAVTKKGALLHDIGKAVDHEIQGTHVEIGRRILSKFSVAEGVIKAMQSHHEEYPYETVESVIVQAADAISAARPGARRGTVEAYLKRLEDLERIALSFPGIEKTYAIQAGRELRVFVKPEEISELEAKKLARSIADRIEQELKYPGEIKVHIIRESRVIEYAR